MESDWLFYWHVKERVKNFFFVMESSTGEKKKGIQRGVPKIPEDCGEGA